MIDYYINGKYNTFIELILDSNHVTRHFNNFQGGAYNKSNYVILDLKTDGTGAKDGLNILQGNKITFIHFFYRVMHCTKESN